MPCVIVLLGAISYVLLVMCNVRILYGYCSLFVSHITCVEVAKPNHILNYFDPT